MASLKLFLDHASQPSRALLVFCKINKLPFELIETRIAKLEVDKYEFSIKTQNMQILIQLKKSLPYHMETLISSKVMQS